MVISKKSQHIKGGFNKKRSMRNKNNTLRKHKKNTKHKKKKKIKKRSHLKNYRGGADRPSGERNAEEAGIVQTAAQKQAQDLAARLTRNLNPYLYQLDFLHIIKEPVTLRIIKEPVTVWNGTLEPPTPDEIINLLKDAMVALDYLNGKIIHGMDPHLIAIIKDKQLEIIKKKKQYVKDLVNHYFGQYIDKIISKSEDERSVEEKKIKLLYNELMGK